MRNTEDFFKNYRGKYSQYWIERWGLIPELPTSFDNANSTYELMAWLQRAFKNLLDDFQQVEAEFEDFKNALVDLLEYLIPELIRRYHDSAEFRAIFIILLEDILAGEERTWVKDLLKELLEVDMREWIEDYLRTLYGFELAQKIYYYNTVSDMKNSTKLRNGDCVITLGYYSPNDGGGATYKIGNDISDNYFVLSLVSELTATLVISNNTVNIKQIGGKSQDSNGKYDNKEYIDAYINRLNALDNKTKRFKLYIPSGIWCFSPTTIYRYQGFSITGDINFAHRGISNEGTIITAMSDNQDFVWQIGNGTGMIYNFELGNFTMSSASYKASGSAFVVDTVYNVNKGALKFQGCAFGHVHTILFNVIYGTAFDITSSWEITFKKFIFRSIGGFTTPVVNFSKLLSSLSSYNPNLSNLMFDTLDFESCAGELINFEVGSYFLNSEIRTIVVEPSMENPDSRGNFNDGIYADTTATKLAIIRINGELNGNHIGTILVNNIALSYGVKNGIQYCYDTIIKTTSSLLPINLDIDSITIHGAGKDYNIILQKIGSPSSLSKVFIGRVYGERINGIKGIFNVKSFPSIKVMDMRYSDFHYDGEYLAPNMLPFNKIQHHAVDSGGSALIGKLFYDANTINKLSLAVKAITYVNEENSKVARFFNDASKKISIRANLQNTMPITFKLKGYVGGVLTTQDVVLTGTGSYKWYDLLNPNTFDDNTYIEITIVTDKSVFLDVLKYN